jgi:serine/threonine-protein kinase HipA
MSERQIEVFTRLDGEDVLAGRLFAVRRRGTESQTFSYNDGYLARPGVYELDPSLPLALGPQATGPDRKIFTAFSDCAPDRWGRQLILRAEAKRVKKEGGARRSFGEIDFLLGVRDDMRQGALRFKDSGAGHFLADEQSGVPSLINLPRLLSAADALERGKETDQELESLLRGGSSLGGARPKAHIFDPATGRVAIAKFPSPNDDRDVMRWEAVSLELAARAGIRVPTFRLHEIDSRAVLLLDRFDRIGDERVPYMSAMTLLGAQDGTNGSYLEISEALLPLTADATADIHELWRRVVFSCLISNFDDHLRNHGFLRQSSGGWSLSPAFDLNPSLERTELHTAIHYQDRTPSVKLALEVADYFRLSREAALAVIRETYAATSTWREVALTKGLSEDAIDAISPAFEHEAEREARGLSG